MQGKWCHHEYETAFAVDNSCHCISAAAFLLSEPVVTAGHTAAGWCGAIFPFYICEFFIDSRLYRAGGGNRREVVWAIICYSAIFGL
jgi:hypothetical protein